MFWRRKSKIWIDKSEDGTYTSVNLEKMNTIRLEKNSIRFNDTDLLEFKTEAEAHDNYAKIIELWKS